MHHVMVMVTYGPSFSVSIKPSPLPVWFKGYSTSGSKATVHDQQKQPLAEEMY